MANIIEITWLVGATPNQQKKETDDKISYDIHAQQ
jgi:hypothetical protein